MNMQVLDSRRDARGGYKVDVSRGQRIGRVSSEWFSRPDDERFLSLGDLARSVRGRSERSRTRVVESALIHVEANRSDPERLALILPGAEAPATPTHWSFGQLASQVGAPAAYLRQLPAPLAAINLQYGLTSHRAEQIKTLETGDPVSGGRLELRAVTGPDYGRIYDHELVEAVQKIAGNGIGDTRWKVPGVLDWGGMKSAEHEELGPDDVHLTYLPLCHTNAQVYSVLASLWAGATIVLMPRFSASRFWPISLAHKVTWTSLVPFCMKALLDQPVPERHYYRRWGNAVCAPPFDHHFGVTTTGWWGMTETVTHGIVGGSPHANAPMSLGRPATGYEIFVLDGEGQPVAPGDVGDLFVRGVRGVSLFLEYAGDPKATAAAFRPDGLFITGDRVRLGNDGCLYFADRSKDMLKVGGENVAASEIEGVIAAVEGVAEVAVVSMPHPMLDEVPAAFVLQVDGCRDGLLDRITAACSAGLADFKIPRLVRIVDTLPRATLEKVAKAELRAQLIAELASATDPHIS